MACAIASTLSSAVDSVMAHLLKLVTSSLWPPVAFAAPERQYEREHNNGLAAALRAAARFVSFRLRLGRNWGICPAFVHGEFSHAPRRLVREYALAALRQGYDCVKNA